MNAPLTAAGLFMLVGCGLLVAGIYELAGQGWALLAGAIPCILLSVVILRGLNG